MTKTLLLCVLLASAFIQIAESVECYDCVSCDDVDENTKTCKGDHCVRFETTTSFDSFCSVDKDYCEPHKEMPHDCFVCDEDLCNSASTVTSYAIISTMIASMLIFFK
ncbi:PREDICTED: uncharacterized protein LOC108558586 [Nicrophorus vespilloides]|uniref:Uncharacterized protein LOC108558586 n=1 Tax=Nicrophorus vespilloides TaxID=110193 RepID=A0ABM1M8Z0_NICVS|nr:PREDICTED: uncharacterized protein LOC108558586 [Nicrophorus vespilloides]